MSRWLSLTHEFVETFPRELVPGVLYLSIPFATTAHSCCCGCGSRVIAPLSPVRWQMTFDGRTVSLSPSIGNWALKCRSHYWIRNNTVHWAGSFSQEQINRARARDARDLEALQRAEQGVSDSMSTDREPTRRWRRRWLGRSGKRGRE